MPLVTVLSIAANGLSETYRAFLATHRIYAATHGYRCLIVGQPAARLTPRECMWLKIALMQLLVAKGPVLYVDADAEIKASAPPIESVFVPGKKIYMAYGVSGRYNAGVIFADGCPDFFEIILENYYTYIPSQDRVHYLIDDNAHIIHFARDNPFVQRLDARWNNSADERLQDYIRHYTGPLTRYRPGYRPNAGSALIRMRLTRSLLARAPVRFLTSLADMLGPLVPLSGRFPKRILDIASRTLSAYAIPT